MKLLHYTTNQNFVLKEITIRNGYRRKSGFSNKPLGGLWASPFLSQCGWNKWSGLETHTPIVLKITRRNMLVIDLQEDLNKLPIIAPESHPLPCIDFEALVREGIHSIHLTKRGVQETKFSYPIDLNPWDCETVLILNNKCIESISTPIYTQIFTQDFEAKSVEIQPVVGALEPSSAPVVGIGSRRRTR